MIVSREERLLYLSNVGRLHGSAALRATVPATFSTSILLVTVLGLDKSLDQNEEERWVVHPYVIQVLVVGFTFVLAFRANFAYGRYWEGATAVHQMLSKWLDVGMSLSSFHYQSRHYNETRPPAFGAHPNVKDGTRDRERLQELTQSQYLESLPPEASKGKRSFFRRRKLTREETPNRSAHSINASGTNTLAEYTQPGRKIINRNNSQFSSHVSQYDDQQPTLFLQELAHLLSLLSAVAMSTLRNDVEGTESPLVEYIPGAPWPPVDPDMLNTQTRMQYHEESRWWTCVYFLFGLTQSDRHKTLYNAARPFGVLGGVSDAEIEQLQQARGPYAKVGLCTMWLQEYISREHLCGSVGDIHAAIMSRCFQFTSDGMIGYNQSRKIAYTPFPFPLEQGTIIVLCCLVIIFPVLFWSFVNNLGLACIMNFATVLCFVGLHEVARELENPFWNAPNDLPLTTFQAQFNEALLVAYSGFHPDAYWEVPNENDEMPWLGEEEKTAI